MSLTKAIFQKSVFFFALIPLFAVWGFWQTYFVGSARPISGLDHFHGIAMFGWCLMLIVQSLLIRQSRRSVHRTVGKFSYLLAPWIAVSTLMLANFQLNARGLTGEGVYVLMLQLSILAQFLVFYSLAIVNRKTSDVHARYMVCTALPLIDPIFARILMFNYLTPEQLPLTQFYTYPLTALILVALVVWDWRSSNRRDVFLPMLFVLVALQLPTFFVTGTAAWQSFAAWYMQLPLS
jgi:hypothetical protein